MKKIILLITFIIATVAIVFSVLEIKGYYDKKKKIDNNTLVQEVEEKIKETEEKIKEKQTQIEQVKEEKKSKIEELESWQKKTKDMESNL